MMNNSKYDCPKLSGQFCFPLYAASRETIKSYRPYLDRIGLTYTQYIVMLVFWEEQRQSVKELGAKLYLDSGTLTPVLKTLEAKGYIERNRSLEDARVLTVELTPAGRSLMAEALAIPADMESSGALTREETATLHRLLYKLLGSLSEAD